MKPDYIGLDKDNRKWYFVKLSKFNGYDAYEQMTDTFGNSYFKWRLFIESLDGYHLVQS